MMYSNTPIDFAYLNCLTSVEKPYVSKDVDNYILLNSKNPNYYMGLAHGILANIDRFGDTGNALYLPEVVHDALLEAQKLHIARISYYINYVVYNMDYSNLEMPEVDYLYNKRYDNVFDYMINCESVENLSSDPDIQNEILCIYNFVINNLCMNAVTSECS